MCKTDSILTYSLMGMMGGRVLMALPDDMKKGWLSENFGNVCVKPSEEGFVASVPDVFFTVKAPKSLRNIFRNMAGKKLVTLQAAEGFGKTPEESRINLSDRISMGFYYGSVRKYCPKEGQDKDALSVAGTLEAIKQNHRLHDHESLELFDFQPLCLDMELEVKTLNYDEFHSHLRLL